MLLNIFINNLSDKIETKLIKFSPRILFRASKFTPEDRLNIQQRRVKQGWSKIQVQSGNNWLNNYMEGDLEWPLSWKRGKNVTLLREGQTILGYKQQQSLWDAQNQLFVDFGLVQAQLRTGACDGHCLDQLEESREPAGPAGTSEGNGAVWPTENKIKRERKTHCPAQFVNGGMSKGLVALSVQLGLNHNIIWLVVTFTCAWDLHPLTPLQFTGRWHWSSIRKFWDAVLFYLHWDSIYFISSDSCFRPFHSAGSMIRSEMWVVNSWENCTFKSNFMCSIFY